MFTLSVTCSASKIERTWKNVEAFYKALMRTNLNEQCGSKVLNPCRYVLHSIALYQSSCLYLPLVWFVQSF